MVCGELCGVFSEESCSKGNGEANNAVPTK